MQDRMLVVGWTFLIALALVVPAPLASAQESPGAIEGIVCAPGWEADACQYGLDQAMITVECPGTLGTGIGSSDATTKSDGDGYFRLEVDCEGPYDVTIDRLGFESQSVVAESGDFLQIMLDGALVEQSFEVYGPEGPMAGVWLYMSSQDASSEYHEAVTDDQGRAVLQLHSGWYGIEIDNGGRVSYEERLLDGQERQSFKTREAPVRDAILEGTVRNQDGDPVEGAQVYVYQYSDCYYAYDTMEAEPAHDGDSVSSSPAYYDPYCDDGRGNGNQMTGPDGQFRFEVYEGYAELNVWKEDHRSVYRSVEIRAGETTQEDVELVAFPERSVQISGRIVGEDGETLPYANLWADQVEWGTYACSVNERDAEPSPEDSAESSMIVEPGRYGGGCDIIVDSKGNFEGTIRPGYQILRIGHDDWRDCQTTQNQDGSMTQQCGARYLSLTQVYEFEPNSQVDLGTLRLPARQEASSILQGWAYDREMGPEEGTLAGVQIHVNSLEGYGWGSAQTDRDGSFQMRVIPGWQEVSVYADGYLRYQTTLEIEDGETVRVDLPLKEGEDQYGYCCYAYAEDIAYESADGGARDEGPSGQSQSDAAHQPEFTNPTSGDPGYADLGGGLGAYRPAAEDKGAPSLGILAVGLGLVGLVALRRRQS